MMLGKDVAAAKLPTEPRIHFPREMEFLIQPQRERLHERKKPSGCMGEIGLENPIEFQKWLVIEGDVVEILRFDAGLSQAVGHGIARKTGIVLDPGKPLFLSCSHDFTVAHEGRGGVVIESADSQDMHVLQV